MNYYYHKQPKTLNKKSKKKFLLLIPFSICTILLILITNTTEKTEQLITISEGESINSITQELKDKNLISSKLLFENYLSSTNLDSKIQIGEFSITEGMTYEEISNIITNVEFANREKVTIPEGLKISQIDSNLAEKNLINNGEFTKFAKNFTIDHPITQYIPTNSLEGFLFPDTYFVDPASFSNEYLAKKMLDNFQNKLPKDWKEKADKLPETDLYSIINMAAILEREVLSPKDKAIVAGILWKRYENDWRIDADAALLYEKNDNSITRADIESNSPYNLRKFKGLPPTPIANPGLESIVATLNPIPSDYWFYITTLDTGEVIYAKTNDEHNSNKFKYLR